MTKVYLPITLLLAIACSQIFGGVMCCCFARSVSDCIVELKNAWVPDTTIYSVDDSSENDVSSEKGAPTSYRCPKCAARANESSPASSDLQAEGTNKTEKVAKIDAPCSCSKFLCVGGETEDSLSLKTKTNGKEWIAVAIPKHSTNIWNTIGPYSSPPLLLLGRHSWRSFACIWRN